MNRPTVTLLSLCLPAFVAVKLAGHVLAAWSWWWVFAPVVPLLAIVVQKLGL